MLGIDGYLRYAPHGHRRALAALQLLEYARALVGFETLMRGVALLKSMRAPGFLLYEPEGKIAVNPEFMLEGDAEIVMRG